MRRVAAHLPGQNSPIGRLNPPSLPYRTEPGGTFYGQLALKGESKGPDICYSAAYTSLRLATSSALQSPKSEVAKTGN